MGIIHDDQIPFQTLMEISFLLYKTWICPTNLLQCCICLVETFVRGKGTSSQKEGNDQKHVFISLSANSFISFTSFQQPCFKCCFGKTRFFLTFHDLPTTPDPIHWDVRQPDPFVIQERSEVGEWRNTPLLLASNIFNFFGQSYLCVLKAFRSQVCRKWSWGNFKAWTFVIKGPEFLRS